MYSVKFLHCILILIPPEVSIHTLYTSYLLNVYHFILFWGSRFFSFPTLFSVRMPFPLNQLFFSRSPVINDDAQLVSTISQISAFFMLLNTLLHLLKFHIRQKNSTFLLVFFTTPSNNKANPGLFRDISFLHQFFQLVAFLFRNFRQ